MITRPESAGGEPFEGVEVAEFERRHEAEYGRSFPDSPKEIVNVRVTGIGETQKIAPEGPPGTFCTKKARSTTGPHMVVTNLMLLRPRGRSR